MVFFSIDSGKRDVDFVLATDHLTEKLKSISKMTSFILTEQFSCLYISHRHIHLPVQDHIQDILQYKEEYMFLLG